MYKKSIVTDDNIYSILKDIQKIFQNGKKELRKTFR